MKEDYDIVLRGHHLTEVLYKFCLLGKNDFQRIFRKNHSRKFTKHIMEIVKSIMESNIRVKIVAMLDDICTKCPEKRDECVGDKLVEDDRKAIDFCSLKIGKIYTSKQILKRINKLVSIEELK